MARKAAGSSGLLAVIAAILAVFLLPTPTPAAPLPAVRLPHQPYFRANCNCGEGFRMVLEFLLNDITASGPNGGNHNDINNESHDTTTDSFHRGSYANQKYRAARSFMFYRNWVQNEAVEKVIQFFEPTSCHIFFLEKFWTDTRKLFEGVGAEETNQSSDTETIPNPDYPFAPLESYVSRTRTPAFLKGEDAGKPSLFETNFRDVKTFRRLLGRALNLSILKESGTANGEGDSNTKEEINLLPEQTPIGRHTEAAKSWYTEAGISERKQFLRDMILESVADDSSDRNEAENSAGKGRGMFKVLQRKKRKGQRAKHQFTASAALRRALRGGPSSPSSSREKQKARTNPGASAIDASGPKQDFAKRGIYEAESFLSGVVPHAVLNSRGRDVPRWLAASQNEHNVCLPLDVLHTVWCLQSMSEDGYFDQRRGTSGHKTDVIEKREWQIRQTLMQVALEYVSLVMPTVAHCFGDYQFQPVTLNSSRHSSGGEGLTENPFLTGAGTVSSAGPEHTFKDNRTDDIIDIGNRNIEELAEKLSPAFPQDKVFEYEQLVVQLKQLLLMKLSIERGQEEHSKGHGQEPQDRMTRDNLDSKLNSEAVSVSVSNLSIDSDGAIVHNSERYSEANREYYQKWAPTIRLTDLSSTYWSFFSTYYTGDLHLQLAAPEIQFCRRRSENVLHFSSVEYNERSQESDAVSKYPEEYRILRRPTVSETSEVTSASPSAPSCTVTGELRFVTAQDLRELVNKYFDSSARILEYVLSVSTGRLVRRHAGNTMTVDIEYACNEESGCLAANPTSPIFRGLVENPDIRLVGLLTKNPDEDASFKILQNVHSQRLVESTGEELDSPDSEEKMRELYARLPYLDRIPIETDVMAFYGYASRISSIRTTFYNCDKNTAQDEGRFFSAIEEAYTGSQGDGKASETGKSSENQSVNFNGDTNSNHNIIRRIYSRHCVDEAARATNSDREALVYKDRGDDLDSFYEPFDWLSPYLRHQVEADSRSDAVASNIRSVSAGSADLYHLSPLARSSLRGTCLVPTLAEENLTGRFDVCRNDIGVPHVADPVIGGGMWMSVSGSNIAAGYGRKGGGGRGPLLPLAHEEKSQCHAHEKKCQASSGNSNTHSDDDSTRNTNANTTSHLDIIENAIRTASEERSEELKKKLESWLRNLEAHRLRRNAVRIWKEVNKQAENWTNTDRMTQDIPDIPTPNGPIPGTLPTTPTPTPSATGATRSSAVSRYHSVACLAAVVAKHEVEVMKTYARILAPHCDEFLFVVANRTPPRSFRSPVGETAESGNISHAGNMPDAGNTTASQESQDTLNAKLQTRLLPILDAQIVEDEWGSKSRDPNMTQKTSALWLQGFEWFAKHFWGDEWHERMVDEEDGGEGVGGVFEEQSNGHQVHDDIDPNDNDSLESEMTIGPTDLPPTPPKIFPAWFCAVESDLYFIPENFKRLALLRNLNPYEEKLLLGMVWAFGNTYRPLQTEHLQSTCMSRKAAFLYAKNVLLDQKNAEENASRNVMRWLIQHRWLGQWGPYLKERGIGLKKDIVGSSDSKGISMPGSAKGADWSGITMGKIESGSSGTTTAAKLSESGGDKFDSDNPILPIDLQLASLSADERKYMIAQMYRGRTSVTEEMVMYYLGRKRLDREGELIFESETWTAEGERFRIRSPHENSNISNAQANFPVPRLDRERLAFVWEGHTNESRGVQTETTKRRIGSLLQDPLLYDADYLPALKTNLRGQISVSDDNLLCRPWKLFDWAHIGAFRSCNIEAGIPSSSPDKNVDGLGRHYWARHLADSISWGMPIAGQNNDPGFGRLTNRQADTSSMFLQLWTAITHGPRLTLIKLREQLVRTLMAGETIREKMKEKMREKMGAEQNKQTNKGENSEDRPLHLIRVDGASDAVTDPKPTSFAAISSNLTQKINATQKKLAHVLRKVDLGESESLLSEEHVQSLVGTQHPSSSFTAKYSDAEVSLLSPHHRSILEILLRIEEVLAPDPSIEAYAEFPVSFHGHAPRAKMRGKESNPDKEQTESEGHQLRRAKSSKVALETIHEIVRYGRRCDEVEDGREWRNNSAKAASTHINTGTSEISESETSENSNSIEEHLAMDRSILELQAEEEEEDGDSHHEGNNRDSSSSHSTGIDLDIDEAVRQLEREGDESDTEIDLLNQQMCTTYRPRVWRPEDDLGGNMIFSLR